MLLERACLNLSPQKNKQKIRQKSVFRNDFLGPTRLPRLSNGTVKFFDLGHTGNKNTYANNKNFNYNIYKTIDNFCPQMIKIVINLHLYVIFSRYIKPVF